MPIIYKMSCHLRHLVSFDFSFMQNRSYNKFTRVYPKVYGLSR
jgi:hypothetical protein